MKDKLKMLATTAICLAVASPFAYWFNEAESSSREKQRQQQIQIIQSYDRNHDGYLDKKEIENLIDDFHLNSNR